MTHSTEHVSRCRHEPMASDEGGPVFCYKCQAPMKYEQRDDNTTEQVWDTLTDAERRGVEKVSAHLDEPDFYTAEELRDLADQMDWLAEGPLREATVEVGGDRPWAWIHKHPHNGPTVQVAFRQPPSPKDFREALTPPSIRGGDDRG